MGVKLLRREEGAALVETALVVPVILLLLFAIFEMGLAFARYQVLSNASREVARIASLFDPACPTNGGSTPAKDAAIQQTLQQFGGALGMNNGIQIQSIMNVCRKSESSVVELRYVHDLPVLDSFIDRASITLVARTVMRNDF